MTEFEIVDFKPLIKGSLIGFATVTMPSGMTLIECPVMYSHGKYWCSPPSKPRFGRDGTVSKDDSGKPLYTPIVKFRTKAIGDKWSASVIEALRLSHPKALP